MGHLKILPSFLIYTCTKRSERFSTLVWASQQRTILQVFQFHPQISQIRLDSHEVYVVENIYIDLATEQFTKILIDTCTRSLKVACPKKKPISNHKLWFDKDCAFLRKNLNMLSNKKHLNPYDANLRHDYHTTRKAFKKLIKCKKSKHLNSQI